jgi:hypothetical protein
MSELSSRFRRLAIAVTIGACAALLPDSPAAADDVCRYGYIENLAPRSYVRFDLAQPYPRKFWVVADPGYWPIGSDSAYGRLVLFRQGDGAAFYNSRFWTSAGYWDTMSPYKIITATIENESAAYYSFEWLVRCDGNK